MVAFDAPALALGLGDPGRGAGDLAVLLEDVVRWGPPVCLG
jgi:hypothetical protein